MPRVRYANGFPVEIDGERVLHGDEIAARLAQPGPFLVTGALLMVMFDCVLGHCPESAVWVLSNGANTDLHSAPLLVAGGTWAPVGVPRWRGDLVVLRVRAYDAACPWGTFCAGSLLVESAVAPPTATTSYTRLPAALSRDAGRGRFGRTVAVDRNRP